MNRPTSVQPEPSEVALRSLESERIVLRRQKRFAISRGLLAILVVLLACSVAAQAQVTSLMMTGDAGDYIGGGQFYFYTLADGTFGAQQNSSQGVSLSFST